MNLLRVFILTTFCISFFDAIQTCAENEKEASTNIKQIVETALGKNIRIETAEMPIKHYQIYTIAENKNSLSAYLFLTSELGLSQKGFKDKIDLAIICDTKGAIIDVSVLKHKETEKYFQKISSGGLLKKWKGLKTTDNQPDAITGATFTSHGINDGISAVLKKLNDIGFFKNKTK
ncbi:MAG: FMN-binding protein [Candidatus Nanoarchaeia archaeon]